MVFGASADRLCQEESGAEGGLGVPSGRRGRTWGGGGGRSNLEVLRAE